MTTVLVQPAGRARVALVALAALPAAALTGALAGRSPLVALAVLVAGTTTALVWTHPEVAGYLMVGVTPLVVGIDRDRLVPMLRPSEALLGVLVALLFLRAAVRVRLGARPALRIGPVTASILMMAVASSVLPLMFMVLRGRPVETDDITNAAVLWKFLGLYALVRYTVRTDRQVQVCLWVSMVVATVVGLIGIFQSLGLFGVREMLVPWYAPFGSTAAVDVARAGSTVGLPAATADLMVFNLAIAAGVGWRHRRAALLLAPVALVLAMAVFSAAEFSSILGLLVGVVCIAARLRRLDLLRWSVPALPVAALALWPTLEPRLVEFQSLHGVPHSWLVRWFNLVTYFWPQLFSGSNTILGVRPSARVPAPGQFGYVWIESGYTWLLWGGGIALAAAFCYFVRAALRANGPGSRRLASPRDVAALASYTAVVVVVVLMVFDPHLTYRGSADALFGLLALAGTAHSVPHGEGTT